MKLVGIMPVRNEAWILGLSLRVALEWCDAVVVGLHSCADDSDLVVNRLATFDYESRINFVDLNDEEWHEMQHRQALLDAARENGATRIAMIDADEIATPDFARNVRHAVETLRRDDMLFAPLYNLRGGIDRYHANGLWGNRIVSVAFEDDPRLGWSGDTFHRREPQGKRTNVFRYQGPGGVMHLWGADERRLLAKHAWYKVTERLRWPHKDVREIDRMYSMCVKGAGGGEAPAKWEFAAVPDNWWAEWRERGWMQHLHLDAAPWQEAEVRRLAAEHGREKFAGLDLFGVV